MVDLPQSRHQRVLSLDFPDFTGENNGGGAGGADGGGGGVKVDLWKNTTTLNNPNLPTQQQKAGKGRSTSAGKHDLACHDIMAS